jgi:nucleoside-diphosphate-sugar epimerase
VYDGRWVSHNFRNFIMRIFLTGATGFIGSKIVPELIGSGYQVLGLARSVAGREALERAGAQAHMGDLADLDSLRAGAAGCDGVIHTAFDHDFQHFAANCDKDRIAILALGEALAGSDRPMVITSGTAMGSAAPGQPAVESVFNRDHPNPRMVSELAAEELLERGINVSVARLSQIHDTTRQGLVSLLIDLARAKGVSAYVGEGKNRWSAAHVTDTARLFRLALERGQPGARYNATAEEGIEMRDIAAALGASLGVQVLRVAPEEAAAHFGWLQVFAGADMSASSTITRDLLDWRPTGPGLLDSLAHVAR